MRSKHAYIRSVTLRFQHDMASLITSHFPIVRFEDGVRKWFNPVSKVRAADRPEERVRLRMIEFLVREAGFSANRMSTEPPVPMQASERAGRADILCFDEFHRPLLLVECKAESVKLSEQTAMQAARYNLQIRAPYILLTNGIRDLLFAIQEDGSTRYVPDFRSVFPLKMKGNTEPGTIAEGSAHADDSNRIISARPITYWQERGLWTNNKTLIQGVGTNNVPIEEAIASFLTRFWTTFGDTTQYIPIADSLIKGINGAFVRTKVGETGHLAAGVFIDSEQQLWLLQARANDKNEPVFRFNKIKDTDISLLLTFVSIEQLINWSSLY